MYRIRTGTLIARNYFPNVMRVLLYAERIVMPDSLQKRVLNNCHMGQSGILRVKFIIRSYVYWPNMDNDTENW